MEILRKEMKLKGLSTIELAIKINVSKQTIYNWIEARCVPTAQYAGALKNLGFSDTACLQPSKNVEVSK